MVKGSGRAKNKNEEVIKFYKNLKGMEYIDEFISIQQFTNLDSSMPFEYVIYGKKNNYFLL